MQEMWVQSLGQEDPLEKEMATYSSVLAWAPELRPLMTLIFIVILVLLVIINVRKERQMKKLNSVK